MVEHFVSAADHSFGGMIYTQVPTFFHCVWYLCNKQKIIRHNKKKKKMCLFDYE